MAHHHILHLLKLIRVRSKTATLGYEFNNLWGEKDHQQRPSGFSKFLRAIRDEKELLRRPGVRPSLGEKGSLTPYWIRVVSALLRVHHESMEITLTFITELSKKNPFRGQRITSTLFFSDT